jgi:hypothetical protein
VQLCLHALLYFSLLSCHFTSGSLKYAGYMLTWRMRGRDGYMILSKIMTTLGYQFSYNHFLHRTDDFDHGVESFSRSRQSLSYLTISQHLMEPESSSSC